MLALTRTLAPVSLVKTKLCICNRIFVEAVTPSFLHGADGNLYPKLVDFKTLLKVERLENGMVLGGFQLSCKGPVIIY